MEDPSVFLLICVGAFAASVLIAVAVGLAEGLLSARVKETLCSPSEST